MSKVTIVNDCALSALRKMRSNSVDCIITSPPYWGLRDYGIDATEWPACSYMPMPGLPPIDVPAETSCHGLEPTLHAFFAHAVLIFEEARRVLKPTGSCWVNMGDGYAGSWGAQGQDYGKVGEDTISARRIAAGARKQSGAGSLNQYPGLKPKDLIGQPWRLAFALQAQGWFLRQDNIWHKPNPMPESIRDRATKSHEYVFHLTKSERYYFDITAWSEPVTGGAHARRAAWKQPDGWASHEGGHGSFHKDGREKGRPDGVPKKCAEEGSGIKSNGSFTAAVVDLVSSRNKRSVWTVGTVPYVEAHYATYPPTLITPPILASTSAKGCCVECGKPWERIIEKTDEVVEQSPFDQGKTAARPTTAIERTQKGDRHHNRDTGQWRATCKCGAETEPATVLDFFAGSGTTGQVALDHNLNAYLVERGPHNVELIKKRLAPFIAAPLLPLH